MTPATAYLSKWSKKSDTYRTMHGALNKVAGVLSDGGKTAETYQWESMRYEVARGIPARLRDAPLAIRTVNKCLVAVRGVLEAAWRMGLVPSEEYRQIEIKNLRGSSGKRKGEAMTPEQLKKLSAAIAAADPRDAALITIMYACGLRRIEVSRLTREDFDPTRAAVEARGKGEKPRTVPVAPEWLAPITKHWRTLESGAPFFSSERGSAITRDGISYIVRCFQHAAGFKFTAHDLRRSYATHLLDGGTDSLIVRDLMGHQSLDTTKIYDRRDANTAKRAVTVLHRPAEKP